MPRQFPLSLLITWALFFCCAVGQFKHEQAVRRSEPVQVKILRAIEISQLLWMIAAFGILIYYFIEAQWYWAFVLAIVGSILGAVISGLLLSIVDEGYISSRGFIAWPILAVWSIFIIHGLHTP